MLPASLELAAGFAVALCGAVALATLLHGRDDGLALAMLCAAVAYVACWGRRTRDSLTVGPVFWLCYNGFVEHRYGALGRPGIHDGIALGLLAASSLAPGLLRAATGLASARRRFQKGSLQPFEPPPPDRDDTSSWN